MDSTHVDFPDTNSLTTGLRTVFHNIRQIDGDLKILDRQPNVYASTFPSEIVTCQTSEANRFQLFCKYAAGYHHDSYGHRGGVEYEASIYRHFLQSLVALAPMFYGFYRNESSGDRWLFLEYLSKSERLSLMEIPPIFPVVHVAHSFGRFHAASQSILCEHSLEPMILYDTDYYRGWARRTRHFSSFLQDRFHWIVPLCQEFERHVTELIMSPTAVIHGECYPDNILIQNGMTYLVDWESAAIAPGEIDLVTLTEGWNDELVHECEHAYQAARWPIGAPGEFERRLNLAKVYVQLRWLGDRLNWTIDQEDSWRFEKLYGVGTQLGLI